MRTRRMFALVIIIVAAIVAFTASSVSGAMLGANMIEVELDEWEIRLPETIPAGDTVFLVNNVGRVAHTLRIEGEGVEAELPQALAPGASDRLEVDLAPGTYEATCPIGNHVALGMRRQFAVEAGDEMGVITGTTTVAPPMETTRTATAIVPTPTATVERTTTPGATVTATTTVTATPMVTATPTMTGTPGGLPETGALPVATPGGDLPGDPVIELVEVATGFLDPVSVAVPPDGSGRIFVVERPGVVRIVQDGEILEEPFLDLTESTLSAFLEQGMYDIAFHPDYATNGLFYVHFAELLRNGDSLIVEYSVSDDNPDMADPESARVIMLIEQPWANHNGGELEFGPDGYLYIGSGDGGWEGDPLGAGQDLSTLLGKLLRIDVDSVREAAEAAENGVASSVIPGGGLYAIPATNPFTQTLELVQLFNIQEEQFARLHTNARPEIWAYGLRNPWRFQFDPETGDLWLPDVGQNVWEEINFQPADSTGGENYGWDFNMGSHCFPIEQQECPRVGVSPVAEYSHDLGSAVIGIGVYRGDAIPDLDGIYLAGDFGSGRIWGIGQTDGGEWQMEELLDADVQITGAGQDEDGMLYVTTCNCSYSAADAFANEPGTLWRIEAPGQGAQ